MKKMKHKQVYAITSRGISENLSEEELAIFDLLYKPDLTDQEKEYVKGTAKRLLQVLKYEKLVLDWRKRQQIRAQVMDTIRNVLDQLSPSYNKAFYDQKCDNVYQHIYNAYQDSEQNVYNCGIYHQAHVAIVYATKHTNCN